MLQVVDREEARNKGLKRYFTGIPCKHGHVNERIVINAQCIDCAEVYR